MTKLSSVQISLPPFVDSWRWGQGEWGYALCQHPETGATLSLQNIYAVPASQLAADLKSLEINIINEGLDRKWPPIPSLKFCKEAINIIEIIKKYDFNAWKKEAGKNDYLLAMQLSPVYKWTREGGAFKGSPYTSLLFFDLETGKIRDRSFWVFEIDCPVEKNFFQKIASMSQLIWNVNYGLQEINNKIGPDCALLIKLLKNAGEQG